MLKILCNALLILLLALPVYADMNGYVAGGSAAAGNNCVGGETMGWTATETTQASMSDGAARVTGVFTAPCTGQLNTAHVYHQAIEANDDCKLAVYLDSGDVVPNDAEDTLVGKSDAITSSIVEWAAGTFASGAITKGQTYWMVVYVGDDGWLAGKGTTSVGFTDFDGTCNGFDLDITEITHAGVCLYPTNDDAPLSAYVTLKAP